MKTERSSNFELLRIISMIFIVAHHYSVNAGFDFSNSISANRIITQVLSIGGKVGLNCFVLISGYFLCKQTTFRWKSIVKYILQLSIFSIAIKIIFAAAGLAEFSIIYLARSVFAYLYAEEWWFASTYLIFIIIAPLLSKMVSKLNKKEHFYLIALLTLLGSVIPTITNSTEFSGLLWFIYLFLIASFIRVYQADFITHPPIKIIYILSTGLSVLSFVVTDLLESKIGVLNGLCSERLPYISREYKLPILISSISLFLIILNMKPFVSKFINTIAAAMFGVYLIHDNPLVRNYLWKTLFKNTQYQDSPYLIVHALLSIIIVFVVCTIISYLYNILIDKAFDKLLNKCSDKIETTYKRAKERLKKFLKNLFYKYTN